MRIAAIIVGIDGWEQYTLPLVESIRNHEPKCDIMVVDNASEKPYPDWFYPDSQREAKGTKDESCIVRRVERACYSKAINYGARAIDRWRAFQTGSLDGYDWYIVLSNDVICTGPFMHMLAQQDGEAVIGPLVKNVLGFDYVEGWCVCIPRKIWERVGGWDERFIGADWEDVAFSTAARQQGFWLEQVELPFVHLDQRQRYHITDFAAVNAHNQALFMREYAGKVVA